MQTPTPATTATHPEQQPAASDRFSEALAQLYGSASAPDDRSGGLRYLLGAAHFAQQSYDEIDWYLSAARAHQADAEVIELLRRAQMQAYDAWQTIERRGLPLLQRWQRETCGYGEDEVTR